MDELESQIAKIALGNTKSSGTYIYVMAEKAPAGSEELYVVAELPLLNSAAAQECEKICLAIASTLKRVYKKPGGENTFENAIAQVNDELGKLAAMGQTQWVDKLNCILGVKSGHNFSIATCGKVSAFLLRNGEYTDISCSQAQSHPLKTFENYATGKIRLNDLLLLSTIQLFNYLSMDRLMGIVSGSDFLTATQTVIQLLKETADPQISFGVILNLQVPMGETGDNEVDLENYIVESPAATNGLLSKGLAYIKTAFALDGSGQRTPKVGLPKVSLSQSISKFGDNAKNFAAKGKNIWQVAKVLAKTAKGKASVQNFRELSPQKKFFLASLSVLLVAVIFSIGVAVHLRKASQAKSQITGQLQAAQSLLTNAQSSLLYKNDSQAADYFLQAKSKLPAANRVDSGNKELYNKVLAQLNETGAQMEKIFSPKVVNLGSLGKGNALIKLPNYLATKANKAIVSYSKQSGKIEDSALRLSIAMMSAVNTGGSTAAVYDGSSLYLWDFSTGAIGTGFSQGLPQKNDFGGMAQYPVNKRVYVADKKTASIISFAPGNDGFAKPIVSVRDASLSQAVDIAIDGNIYALTNSGISKFQSGRPVDFNLGLITPFSGNGKIYTQKDFAYIYLLDSGNNQIIILDKKGGLVNTLKSPDFTKLKDFQVDEKAKVIYVLNDGSLLKVSLP